eukprot:2137403-Amphidinium_carterae.1
MSQNAYNISIFGTLYLIFVRVVLGRGDGGRRRVCPEVSPREILKKSPKIEGMCWRSLLVKGARAGLYH